MTGELLTLPTRPRIANVTGKQPCPHCDDEAIVLVDNAAAPCPFCERGFRVEFGIGARDGVEYENPDGGPWGPDGYWRGRDIPAGL